MCLQAYIFRYFFLSLCCVLFVLYLTTLKCNHNPQFYWKAVAVVNVKFVFLCLQHSLQLSVPGLKKKTQTFFYPAVGKFALKRVENIETGQGLSSNDNIRLVHQIPSSQGSLNCGIFVRDAPLPILCTTCATKHVLLKFSSHKCARLK